MKNITTIERIAMQKTAIKKTAMEKTAIAKITAKITTTALLFFLAVIHFDDELKSPSSAGEQQIWFLRWFCDFGWLSGRQQQKHLTASETFFFSK